MTESSTKTKLLERLSSRIKDAWKTEPVYIDPIIAPGLTDSQTTAIEHASKQAGQSGIVHFIAITPVLPRSDEPEWSRFTSDLAYAMHKDNGGEQTIVLFSQADDAARSYAYLVDANGPAIPPGSDFLARSSSDDFLPVELAVPYQLQILVAAAQGTEPPAPPDFDTRDAGDRNEDYIEATGLDNGNPDALVFGATAIAALGLSIWVLRRREKYSWRTSLTTKPDPVRTQQLPERVDSALEPLPEPQDSTEEMWAVYDRSRRVQQAIRSLIEAYPDWASSVDFSHRFGVENLLSTHKWVRARLRGSSKASSEAPRFCFLFPHHRNKIEEFALKQEGTTLTVDMCDRCRSEINDGHEPECLMVPKRPGSKKPIPYYQRSDVYALSGFGSFQPLEDTVLETLGTPSTSATGGRG
ncbi:hypothetical protein [Brevibacterium zhoupengii]|uniref:hypothetical protein n=1 Tax=Brevibacterium zhoupengii TaxID=2898795 RepID=UPI001E585D6A|nr:hypothetical protein [Brevibacterium zhoupengii]